MIRPALIERETVTLPHTLKLNRSKRIVWQKMRSGEAGAIVQQRPVVAKLRRAGAFTFVSKRDRYRPDTAARRRIRSTGTSCLADRCFDDVPCLRFHMPMTNHDEAYEKHPTALSEQVLNMLRFAEFKNAAIFCVNPLAPNDDLGFYAINQFLSSPDRIHKLMTKAKCSFLQSPCRRFYETTS